jgi:AbrB family looped-hinge helix DNA binding protein
METITLSSKGQLVIPKAVRQSAHLAPGDVLSVRYVDGEIRLRPVTAVAPTSLAEVAGCLAQPGRKPLGQAQTQAAIKARLKAQFKAVDAAG